MMVAPEGMEAITSSIFFCLFMFPLTKATQASDR